MNTMMKLLAGAAAGAGLLALTATSASAFIACTGNVCWHSHERYHYPRHARVVVHSDTWHYGPSVTIREHEGRGYWHGDAWTNW